MLLRFRQAGVVSLVSSVQLHGNGALLTWVCTAILGEVLQLYSVCIKKPTVQEDETRGVLEGVLLGSCCRISGDGLIHCMAILPLSPVLAGPVEVGVWAGRFEGLWDAQLWAVAKVLWDALLIVSRGDFVG